MDWNTIRAEFPALSRWTYLNTATFGQIPLRGNAAIAEHGAHRDEFACGDFLNWYDDADRLRESLARLLHATSEDIAFAPSAAHALAIVVAGLELGAQDSVLTLQGEFPNQLYQPNVRDVPWSQFYKAVDSSVKLVAISEVNYATGFRPPLAEISAFLSQRSIPLFVDGTQSAGVLQVDLQKTPRRCVCCPWIQMDDLSSGSGILLHIPRIPREAQAEYHWLAQPSRLAQCR